MPAIGPYPTPADGCKPAAPPALTAEQQTKYDEFLSAVKSWETLPKSTAKDAGQEPLSDTEKQWLTRECLLRYLRATKWNLPQAVKRVQETLVWRREYGTDSFTADYISPENETGKQVLLGYDNEGRPCLYLLPQNQNTKAGNKQVEHLVYMLEASIDLTPPGQETLALLIDFRNSSAGSQPSIGQSRQVMSILQNHYPERLGRALITHLPWYVTAFLKMLSPFIDPVTKTKMRYNEPLTDHIPASQLMKVSGGEVDFQYDHATYWPTLTALVTERRAARKERWQAAGGIIGESEVYLWGGDEKPIGGAKEGAAPAAVPEANGTPAAPVVEAEKKPEEEIANGVAKLDVKDGEEPKKVEA